MSERLRLIRSQSLSGWDGVFHPVLRKFAQSRLEVMSQSLSGWDGVFHKGIKTRYSMFGLSCRNPFQGGMGFFTRLLDLKLEDKPNMSQSLSGWDGVFH